MENDSFLQPAPGIGDILTEVPKRHSKKLLFIRIYFLALLIGTLPILYYFLVLIAFYTEGNTSMVQIAFGIIIFSIVFLICITAGVWKCKNWARRVGIFLTFLISIFGLLNIKIFVSPLIATFTPLHWGLLNNGSLFSTLFISFLLWVASIITFFILKNSKVKEVFQ